MNDVHELISQLRWRADGGPFPLVPLSIPHLCADAADALAAQAAEIKRLTRERDEAVTRCGELAIDQITANNRATAAEAEAARLREALSSIAYAPPGSLGPTLRGCIERARAALRPQP